MHRPLNKQDKRFCDGNQPFLSRFVPLQSVPALTIILTPLSTRNTVTFSTSRFNTIPPVLFMRLVQPAKYIPPFRLPVSLPKLPRALFSSILSFHLVFPSSSAP